MGWFRKEVKETDETKDTSEDVEKDNEYVSEFDKRYKVDENGNYKYHDTPEDPTKNQETDQKSDAQDDDDEMDADLERSGGKEIDDDNER